jgi:hypothetical protein
MTGLRKCRAIQFSAGPTTLLTIDPNLRGKTCFRSSEWRLFELVKAKLAKMVRGRNPRLYHLHFGTSKNMPDDVQMAIFRLTIDLYSVELYDIRQVVLPSGSFNKRN